MVLLQALTLHDRQNGKESKALKRIMDKRLAPKRELPPRVLNMRCADRGTMQEGSDMPDQGSSTERYHPAYRGRLSSGHHHSIGSLQARKTDVHRPSGGEQAAKRAPDIGVPEAKFGQRSDPCQPNPPRSTLADTCTTPSSTAPYSIDYLATMFDRLRDPFQGEIDLATTSEDIDPSLNPMGDLRLDPMTDQLTELPALPATTSALDLLMTTSSVGMHGDAGSPAI